MTGIIYKCIGGFYTVKASDGHVIECKPRGLFRKDGNKLVAGDRVTLAQEAGTVYIDELLPRKNVFIRPPVANVDIFFIVASMAEPPPNFLVLDKLIMVALASGAQPVLLLTKTDLAPPEEAKQMYAASGMPVIEAGAASGQGIGEIQALLKDKLCVFCGNTGVGKSTLLNALLPDAGRATGEISKKLGRGRHTTREVELFEVAGGLVGDTPGFSNLELQQVLPLQKEDVQFGFPEIAKLAASCRFNNCAHLHEPGCAVRQAVEDGHIPAGRYQNYLALYQQVQQDEKY